MLKKPETIPEPKIPEYPRVAAPEPSAVSNQVPVDVSGASATTTASLPSPCSAGVPLPAFLIDDDGEDPLAGGLPPFEADDAETPTPELSSYGPPATRTEGDDGGDDDEPTPVPSGSR